MKIFKRKKGTVFDHFADGTLDDRAIARRMRRFLTRGSPNVALRTLNLYDTLPDDKKEAFRRHGLTPALVEKSRKRIAGNER